MIWFIIAAVLSLMLALRVGWTQNDAGEALATFLCSLLVAGLVALGVNFWFIAEAEKIYKADQTIELVSLNDGQQTSGSFFLATGTFSGYDVYRFYSKNADGGMQMQSTYASDGTIYEREGVSPSVTYWYPHKRTNRWMTVFGSDPKKGHRLETFIVPPGSVKQGFTLDTQ
jgi:hypothetical protein